MKILAIHNNSGSRFYRLVPQLKWMQKQGHKVCLESHDVQHLFQMVEWADVVIVEMIFSEEIMKGIKALGKKLIFECDDLIHTVPDTHYSYEETKGWRKIKWWWRIYKTLRHCDGFICTTPKLKRLYGWMAKKSFVFENYSSLEHWMKEPKKNLSKDRIRILWAGSTSHTGDLNWVRPIMEEILEKYPHVQFIYVGHGGVPTDDLYAKFVYGEDIFEGMSKEQREAMLPVQANVWPYILAGLQADIGIAPLENNYFNSFKSQCKYLEYGINEIPAVYSKWHYTDVKDSITGMVADSPEEWIEKLSLLIENDKMRRTIGESARKEVVEKFNINKHMTKWQGFVENFYESINSA